MFRGGFDVMLYVRDVSKSVAFYHDVLGLEVEGYWSDEAQGYVSEPPPDGNYVALRAGDAKITLHGTDDEVRGGGLIVHLEVDDVDAYHARLRDAGYEPTEPRDMPWSWRMTFFRDPDGHRFGLYQTDTRPVS